MLKKTMTYEDYDGILRTEDFYFNLTKAEVAEMEMSYDGGLTKMYEQIVKAKDSKRIVETFKDLVLRSYGEKSLDGRRFMKSDEIREAFAHTEAYSDLFMELATDDVAAAEFFNGILPKPPVKQAQTFIPSK